jgi:hypothetical protein
VHLNKEGEMRINWKPNRPTNPSPEELAPVPSESRRRGWPGTASAWAARLQAGVSGWDLWRRRVAARRAARDAEAQVQVLGAYRQVIKESVQLEEAKAWARIREAEIEAEEHVRDEEIEEELCLRDIARLRSPEEAQRAILEALEVRRLLLQLAPVGRRKINVTDELRSLSERRQLAQAHLQTEDAEAQVQVRRMVRAASDEEGEQVAAQAVRTERALAEYERIRRGGGVGHSGYGSASGSLLPASVEWSLSDDQIQTIALKAVRHYGAMPPLQAEREYANWKQQLALWFPPYAAVEIARRADEFWNLR